MMKKKGSFIPSLIVLRVFTSPIPHEARFINLSHTQSLDSFQFFNFYFQVKA